MSEEKFLHLLKKVFELREDINSENYEYTGDQVAKIINERFPELETYKEEIYKRVDDRLYKRL